MAGTEDHDKSGVYPAVDDAGVQHYHIEPHVLPSLVKPPVAIAKGTLPLMPKPAAPAAPSPITCSPPERSDGKAMWELANSTTTLDTNSPYAYMTFAAHFASECLGIAQGRGNHNTEDGTLTAFNVLLAHPPHPPTTSRQDQ